MPTPYFAILDNTLIDEPLAPGLPYWIFPTETLPTQQTAQRFVEDVLYQSELWANAGRDDEWLTLRLLECRSMCSRCGHLVVRIVGDDETPIHVVWFIARNPHPEIMGHQAVLHLGIWHEDYLDHRCEANFFGKRQGH